MVGGKPEQNEKSKIQVMVPGSGATRQWGHQAVGPSGSGTTRQWGHQAVEPPGSGATRQWGHQAVGGTG